MFRSISLGEKSRAEVLHLSVSLKVGDPKGLQQFADSVSDPKSANYHRFITPNQVGNQFGMPLSEIQKVTNYLTSQGMQIKLIGKNRLSILVDATVAQTESAFKTTIENFNTPGSATGGTHYSFTTAPMVPATIAPDFENIGGLENFTQPKRRSLSPTQLRTLYSVSPIYGGGSQGQGRTIGITSFDGFAIADEVTFVSTFGLPSPTAGAGTNIKVETIDGGSQSTTPAGEANLDIQATIAMAPLCNLIVYDGGNNEIIDVLTKETNDNTADIITDSYGWQLDTATSLAAHNLHLSMTSQGITYMVAAGDTGTDFQGFNYPDIDPEVLSVGGTSVTVNTNNTRKTEVGWNNSEGAGGGGWIVTSDTFNIHPTWQKGTGVPSASAVPYHLIPDISFDADPDTAYFIFMTKNGQQNEYSIGGTSGAAPTCAGSLADAEQQLILLGSLTADGSGNFRFGRIQDLLYSFDGDSSVFFDVTSGTNGNLPSGTVSSATVGWDTDSGWGPIIWSGFVAKLANTATLTDFEISPNEVVGGNTSTGTVTLSNAAAGSGVTVSLSSNGADAQVPVNVVVPAGATTATFTVATNAVSSSKTIKLSATLASITLSTNITIDPPSLASVDISPTTIIGGNAAGSASVTLDGNAPTGGLVVHLSSSSLNVQVPPTVTVAAGATTATFVLTTSVVNAKQSVIVTGTLGLTSQSSTISIVPASLSTLSLSPDSVVGGSSTGVTGTVSLNGKAGSAGDIVFLTSSNTSIATVPASVTVLPGSTVATFPVTTFAVNSNIVVTITATLGTTTKASNLTVARVATISGNVTFGSYIGAKPTSVTLNFRHTGASSTFMTMTVPLGAGGNYVAANVPALSYDVYIQTGTWLRRTLSLNLTLVNATGANFALINGDVNGDNRIDLSDLRLLSAARGSSPGDKNWNPRADLNGDGKVDSSDYAIVYANYGRIGNP